MHPLEFLFFQFFVLLPAILVPMHWAVYILVVGYTYLIGMIDHCGIKVSWPLPMHSGNRFHDDHHVYFHCNYGHHTQVFDVMHGTVRREDRRYGEDVFGEPIEAAHKAESTSDEELIAQGREQGWRKVYWQTRADNAAARRLYDSFAAADGFVRYTVELR